MKHEEGVIARLHASFVLHRRLVGAGVALLLAPRAGEETREKIKDLRRS